MSREILALDIVMPGLLDKVAILVQRAASVPLFLNPARFHES